jgi:hypothetical protein
LKVADIASSPSCKGSASTGDELHAGGFDGVLNRPNRAFLERVAPFKPGGCVPLTSTGVPQKIHEQKFMANRARQRRAWRDAGSKAKNQPLLRRDFCLARISSEAPPQTAKVYREAFAEDIRG